MKSLSRIAAFGALLLAAQAQGQIAPGYSGSSTTSYTTDANEFWQTVRSYGVCFAKNTEAKAWELIATDPDSKAEAAVYKQMSRGSTKVCLNATSLQAPVPLIRGAIAEGLYKNGSTVPAELRQEAPPEGQAVLKLGEAARCYIAGHRVDAEKLLADTAPGSKKELAALQAMSDDFYSCLPEIAQKRGFNPTQIRYRLAEALLRMPAAAPTASAAPGNE